MKKPPQSGIAIGHHNIELDGVVIRGFEAGVSMTEKGRLKAKNSEITSHGTGVLVQKGDKSPSDRRHNAWYEKPIGIIVLSTIAGFVVWGVVELFN